MDDYLSFFDLAQKLEVSYDTVRRTIARYSDELGITILKRKTSSSRGALTQCISLDAANRLITFLDSKTKDNAKNDDQEFFFQRFGYFYIVQLVPELMPNRVKIGYTDNLAQRLRDHQTSAPTARYVKYWECKRSWDQAVMDSITRSDCQLVMNEVYEGDVTLFVQRADEFFALLPTSKTVIPLSEHSPLRDAVQADEDNVNNA
jgi:T5orf172 domain